MKGLEYVEEVESRLGKSSFIVETGRGYHLYYRGENRFKNPFTFAVDIKFGWNSYVVGPCSLRPDGVVYKPIKGDFIDPPLTKCNVPLSLLCKPRPTERGLTPVAPSGKGKAGSLP